VTGVAFDPKNCRAVRDWFEAPGAVAIPTTPEPAPRPRISEDEIREVWGEAVTVDQDPEAMAWLKRRNFKPAEIKRLSDVPGIMRVVRPNQQTPSWAEYWNSGYRLIFQVVDAVGIVGLRARWIGQGAPQFGKVRSARGPMAASTLGNWHWCNLLWNKKPPKAVVVVEGEPDFLDALLLYPDAAIAGICSGWNLRLGELIPAGTRVVVMTHDDEQGRKYLQSVARSAPLADVVDAVSKPAGGVPCLT
jgi:hypothetical protein